MQFTLPDDRYRRLTGLALGAILGLALGLVSQFADRVALPGVPLHQPPLGPAGNALGMAVVGAALGLLVSWMRSGIAGTAIAALVTVVAFLTYNYATRGDTSVPAATFLVTSLVFIAPLWGMVVPLVGAVRWAAGNIEEAKRDGVAVSTQLWRPLLLLVVVVGVGLLLRYPERARPLLLQTHLLLQKAQTATAQNDLPPSLQTPLVGDFLANGRGPYELKWESYDIERYRIPRPGRNFMNHSVVVAHFESGWNLVCLYVVSDEPPICQGMNALPG